MRHLREDRHPDLDRDDVDDPGHHPHGVPGGVGAGGEQLGDEHRQQQSGRPLGEGERVVGQPRRRQLPNEPAICRRARPVVRERPPQLHDADDTRGEPGQGPRHEDRLCRGRRSERNEQREQPHCRHRTGGVAQQGLLPAPEGGGDLVEQDPGGAEHARGHEQERERRIGRGDVELPKRPAGDQQEGRAPEDPEHGDPCERGVEQRGRPLLEPRKVRDEGGAEAEQGELRAEHHRRHHARRHADLVGGEHAGGEHPEDEAEPHRDHLGGDQREPVGDLGHGLGHLSVPPADAVRRHTRAPATR